jgi:hypothetical protein
MDVCCLGTAIACGDVEFDFLAFIQRFETIALNSRVMYEYIVPAINLDETVAFFCVEPFNCTFQVNNLLEYRHSWRIYKVYHH